MPRHAGLTVSAVGALSFVGSLAESSVLVLLTLVADGLIRGADQIEVAGLALERSGAVAIALALVVVRVLTIVGAAIVSSRFSSSVTSNAQWAIMTSYLRASYVSRTRRPPGDLNAVMVSHTRFTGDVAGAFAMVSASLCGLLAFGGTSLVVNPIATLGIAAIGLAILALMRPLRSRTRAVARSVASSSRLLGTEVSEVESLHREIELFQVANQVRERVDEQSQRMVESLRKLRVLSMATPQLFQAALLAAAVLSLMLVVQSVDGSNLASVGSVVLLLIRSMSSAQQYVTASQRLIDQSSYAEAVRDLVETLSQRPSSFGRTRPSSLTPVHLDRMEFTYDGTTNVLSGVDIALDAGELVGLVGPSGAGKSTLVELLLRLREPTGGTIRADRTDWSEIDPLNFARRVAFVPQQAVTITGTVAENVDLFRGLPETRIRQAIKEAHLEGEVDALPDGIHTRLGPDDRSLSGGQRQRLTIARALAGDPEILILDEPTSALDALSEATIRQTLEELPTGRLVLVIAHRFSTLRSCSRIVVLDHGRVEMDATPEEVARDSDFFRTMVNEGRNDAG